MKANLKVLVVGAFLIIGASNATNAAVYRWSFQDNANATGVFAFLDFDTVTFDFRIDDNGGQYSGFVTNSFLTGLKGVNGIAFDFLNGQTVNSSATTIAGTWGNTSIGDLSSTNQPSLNTAGPGYDFGFATTKNDVELQDGQSTMFNFGNVAFANIAGVALRYNTNQGALNSNGTWVTGQLVNGGAPVPEAQSYAMFLAGLGLIGFVARRRKD